MPPNPLNLKQRLAALSTAPSSPTSPHNGAITPKSPARRKFTAPWARRNCHTQGAEDERDKVQDVMNKLIYQAGVDFETRPMVVLNASAMPDPREVNYDTLLCRVLGYLNLYVESDYTVVFFAAGSRHTPGWNWVWKAYRSLSRKYRKNLKRLFIVHSTFFSKMLFSLAGASISPKFFRKISYTDTLSELAHQVPLTQIDIPPAVYQENSKHERQITIPTQTLTAHHLFGVPLEDIMGYDGEKGGLPRVVKDCLQYLRETGLEQDGLFRRSPNSVLLRQVQEAYDRGNVVMMSTINDPHLAAVLLKKYLRDLPDPIFPEKIYPVIRRCPPLSSEPAVILHYLRDTLLMELPTCAYILLNNYLHLLHEISLRASSNRMDAHNLAVVLCPNLVKGPDPLKDVAMCAVPLAPPSTTSTSTEAKTSLGAVIKYCIEHYYEVFDDIQDRSEAIPVQRRPQGDQQAPPSPDRRYSGFQNDDDDEIDDAMLVMPIGPGAPSKGEETPTSPRQTTSGGAVPYKTRVRSPKPPGAKGGSFHATGENGNGTGGVGTISKSKSMISIDNGDGNTGTRRGSISVGRRTRKSSGAGVEAIGITAGGFFSAPNSAPPVPSFPPVARR